MMRYSARPKDHTFVMDFCLLPEIWAKKSIEISVRA